MSDTRRLSFEKEIVPNIISIDPNVQRDVYLDYTFRSLKLSPTETISKEPGNPLRHQELLARLYTYTGLNRVLLYHEVGTGKSCTSSLILQRNYEDVISRGYTPNPALVLLKNPQLVETFKREMVDICHNREYFKTGGLNNRTRNRELEKIYDIRTYGEFYKDTSNKDEKSIRNEFSNRIIIMDEIHNIVENTKEKDNISKKDIYSTLLKLVDGVENVKIILLTATPVWNEEYDIATIMNLLLTKENRLPTREKFKEEFYNDDILHDHGKRILRKKFLGKVSFIRALDYNVKKIYEADYDIDADDWKIVPFISVMSDEQRRCVIETQTTTDTFYTNSKSANTLYLSNIDIKDVAYIKDPKTVDDKKKIKNLRMVSEKIFKMLEAISNHPEEVVYINTSIVTKLGGVNDISIILSNSGFKKLDKIRDNCVDSKGNGIGFITISSDVGSITSDIQRSDALKSFGKNDNKYGHRCRILVGSDVTSEGITISNVRQLHILVPQFVPAKMEQITGRVLRASTHENFKGDERYLRIYNHCSIFEDSMDETDTTGATSAPGADDDTADDTGSSVSSTDMHIFNILNSKETRFSPIHRILKECSIDLYIAYDRNVRETDKDGTKECDYMSRLDIVSDIRQYDRMPIDYIGFYTFYKNTIIDTIIKDIRALFAIYSTYHIDHILDILTVPKTDRGISDGSNDISSSMSLSIHTIPIFDAITKMIEDHMIIKDRYGFERYLLEDNDILYLATDTRFCIYNRLYDTVYIEHPIIYQETDISTFILDLQERFDIEQFLYKDIVELKTLLYSLDESTRVTLYETMYPFIELIPDSLKSELESRCEKYRAIVDFYNSFCTIFSHLLLQIPKRENIELYVRYINDIEENNMTFSKTHSRFKNMKHINLHSLWSKNYSGEYSKGKEAVVSNTISVYIGNGIWSRIDEDTRKYGAILAKSFNENRESSKKQIAEKFKDNIIKTIDFKDSCKIQYIKNGKFTDGNNCVTIKRSKHLYYILSLLKGDYMITEDLFDNDSDKKKFTNFKRALKDSKDLDFKAYIIHLIELLKTIDKDIEYEIVEDYPDIDTMKMQLEGPEHVDGPVRIVIPDSRERMIDYIIFLTAIIPIKFRSSIDKKYIRGDVSKLSTKNICNIICSIKELKSR